MADAISALCRKASWRERPLSCVWRMRGHSGEVGGPCGLLSLGWGWVVLGGTGSPEEDLGEGSGCHLVQALQTDVCPSLSSRPATRPPPDCAGFSSLQEHFGGHPESGTHSTPHMFTSKGGITQGVRGQGAQSSWARGRQDFPCPEAALPARPGWGAGGAWLAKWPADVALLAPLPA